MYFFFFSVFPNQRGNSGVSHNLMVLDICVWVLLCTYQMGFVCLFVLVLCMCRLKFAFLNITLSYLISIILRDTEILSTHSTREEIKAQSSELTCSRGEAPLAWTGGSASQAFPPKSPRLSKALLYALGNSNKRNSSSPQGACGHTQLVCYKYHLTLILIKPRTKIFETLRRRNPF